MDEYGPCLCGGCTRCLHDQGYWCGNEQCTQCEKPVEPLTIRVRADGADYSWEGERGYVGHDDRLDLSFWRDGVCVERAHFDLAEDGAAEEMVEYVADMVGEQGDVANPNR